MANRHLARSVVLQTLFEVDMAGDRADSGDVLLTKNIAEFAPDTNDDAFMRELLRGTLAKKPDLDLVIEKAAPEWPINKIDPIDRNILRIGLFELLFSDRGQVPPKVAINEAIELSKTFGSEASSRFVNGVLGAVYKEIGEPGKEEVGKKKEQKEIKTELLAGGVVYADHDGEMYLALVHDVFGRWTLSKGHVEKDSSPKHGIIRIVKEELGLDGVPEDELGGNEYIASHPEKGKIRKKVTYFLVKAPFDTIELKRSGGLDDARWFRVQDTLDLNFYSDMLPIITKGIQTLVARLES